MYVKKNEVKIDLNLKIQAPTIDMLRWAQVGNIGVTRKKSRGPPFPLGGGTLARTSFFLHGHHFPPFVDKGRCHKHV